MTSSGRQRFYSGGPLEKTLGYTRATRVGDTVFVSGSTALKDGAVVGIGDPAAQTRQTIATISEALQAAGSSLEEVVRYRVYITNVDDFPAIGDELANAFGGIHPSGTLVVIAGLVRPELVVEIEVDAIIGSAAPLDTD
jgi:enamine deaminase RidA (YjgF/YER057c/UK114 family)